jgi:hypothetical protein
MATFQCSNIGLCSRADACEKFTVQPGDTFICPIADPNCHEHRIEVRKSPASKGLIAGVAIAVAALALGWLAWAGISQLLTPKITVEQALQDVWPWLK